MKKAIIAVARKLLATIFAMLKNRERYCPQKTGRSLTKTQIARMLAKQLKQYERLCQQAVQAGLAVQPLTNTTPTTA